MFERFTTTVRNVVIGAQHEARLSGAVEIGSTDLLVALIRSQDETAARLLDGHQLTVEELTEEFDRVKRRGGLTDEEAAALSAVGVDIENVIRSVEATFGKDALAPAGRPKRHVPFSTEAKRTLEQCLKEALSRKHKYIGSEHLLLALLSRQSLAGKTLEAKGVTYQAISDQIAKAS
ncbi:Clp protease N-terminal domain-containing protein [Kibdelosporangium aridum]|uniref:Clp amino terminal domain-containing protein, pathogenicity island component n=1 Tax=Kibdelosporangium aridum TaxID=2030 RepID=A0A1W2D4B1_KIBAR|nr:Clp protease N-terminal domain-containing protein [Kibdelosporangium aridum]SMC92269.1 Clp amino terminal domain-containing protein, pathogenicity island component [Kibdelosporangium aridum]